MWILMYVFSYSMNPIATSQQSDWRLSPNVVFQEFSSEARCQSAKLKLDSSLKDVSSKFKASLEELKIIGAGGPKDIIITYNVECIEK